MSSIKKYHNESRKVSGCVMSLLVVLEVRNIESWSGDDEPEEKHVVDDSLPVEDVNKSNESSARHTDDVLRCSEGMPIPSDSRGNVEGYMDRTPVGCSISGVQVQDEVNFQVYKDSPAIVFNASTDKDLQGQIVMKDAEIAALKKQLQDKDDMHRRNIEVKDCEIAILNEKILSLLADGNELREEFEEHITHAVTQANRPVRKDDDAQQRSLVKNLKAKKRKGTEKEEFVYPQRSKCQKGVQGGPDGDVDKGMVDVDAYEPGPKKPSSKLDEIKGLQTNKVFRLLSSEDKMKIDQIWNKTSNRVKLIAYCDFLRLSTLCIMPLSWQSSPALPLLL